MANSIVFDGEKEDEHRVNSRKIQGLRKELLAFFDKKDIRGGSCTNPAFADYATKTNTAVYIVKPLNGIEIKHFRDSLKRSGAKIINETVTKEDKKARVFEFEPHGILDSFML